MNFFVVVLIQVVIMFLLISGGFLLGKLKLITKSGLETLTNILLYLANPLVVLNAFQIDYNETLMKNLLFAFLLAGISHLLSIVLAKLFIHKSGVDPLKPPVEKFAVIYSNCGFMAFPLINALFGNEGLFYASAYLCVFNILSWTHGYILMSGKFTKATAKKAFLSPVVIASVLGLILFLLRIKLPYIIAQPVGYFASLNTPLAMLVLGANIASFKLASAFKSKRCWYVVLLSCIVVPLIMATIYLFLPIDENVILVNLIAVACPPAITTLLFATKHKQDERHASNILTLANICSILTIPAVILYFTYLNSFI